MTGGKFKKKRSFLQTAKKFGRLGQRGRGANIAQVYIIMFELGTVGAVNYLIIKRFQIRIFFHKNLRITLLMFDIFQRI